MQGGRRMFQFNLVSLVGVSRDGHADAERMQVCAAERRAAECRLHPAALSRAHEAEALDLH